MGLLDWYGKIHPEFQQDQAVAQAQQLALQQAKLAAAQKKAQMDAQSGLLGGVNGAGQQSNPMATPASYGQLVTPSNTMFSPQGSPVQGQNVAPTQQGLLDAGVQQDRIGGILGQIPTQQQYEAKRQQLMAQANPDLAMQRMQMAPALAGMSEQQKAAFMIDPSKAADAYSKAQFPESTAEQKVAAAVDKMAPDDPQRKPLQAWLDKQGYNKDKDPLYIDATKASTNKDLAETDRARAQIEALKGGNIPDEVINGMADQYLAGDKSVFQSLGKGTQGSQNIARLRTAIASQAHAAGLSGSDVAAKMAMFQADTAGLRTAAQAGAKMDTLATEVNKFAGIAREASAKVPRGSFVPLTQAEQAIQAGTSSPELAAFVAANTSLVNAYSAVAGRGTPTVSGQEHAYKMLSTAMSPEAYNAVVDQLITETEAAKQSPNATIEDIRKRISSPNGGGVTMPAAANPSASGQPVATVPKIPKWNPSTGKFE